MARFQELVQLRRADPALVPEFLYGDALHWLFVGIKQIFGGAGSREAVMTFAAKAVRYLIGGLVIGGFWYLNRGRNPWEDALRTIIVFALVMTLIKGKLKRQSVDVHLVPLVVMKAVLVVAAAAVEEAIKPSAGQPALLVSIGLGGAVFLAGLLFDRFFFTRSAPPSASTASTASHVTGNGAR